MSTFESLGLSQQITEAVGAIGFETPTAIQQQAIPHLLSGEEDFIGLAQTGTGKTAAFGLPLIQRTDTMLPFIQSLVLAPTRELCLQICRELESFASNQPGLKLLAVYGGADIVRQMKGLERGVHILVATPGRLRDLMRRGKVDFAHLQHVVLDEADEMLNMGFKEEIDDILQSVPENRRTWLFSATMPKEVRRISEDYMENPFELSVGQQNTSNADISHRFVFLRPAERYEALRRFIDFNSGLFALVFVRTRRDAAEVAERLTQDGYRADALHGDLSQHQRDRVMGAFRNRHLRILVATDVAARGIDVDDITHVFHFNIPDDIAFYTHRSGRTGRAGKKGESIILAHPKDKHLLKKLEKTVKIKLEPTEVPNGDAIFEQRLLGFFARAAQTPPHPAIEKYLPQIVEELGDMSREELALRLATSTMGHSLASYANSRPIGQAGPKDKPRLSRTDSRKLFINLGDMDLDGKGGMLSFLCEQGGISSSDIGKIDLQKKHAFVQVEEKAAARLIKAIDGLEHNGRTLRVNDGDTGPKGKKGKKGKGPRKKKEKAFRKR